MPGKLDRLGGGKRLPSGRRARSRLIRGASSPSICRDPPLSDDPFLKFVPAINSFRIEPTAICFDVTETAAIRNCRKRLHFLKSLKSIGCRSRLSYDFGSGLCSSRYLKSLPVDSLKDRRRVRAHLVDSPFDAPWSIRLPRSGECCSPDDRRMVGTTRPCGKLTLLGIDYAQGTASQPHRAVDAAHRRPDDRQVAASVCRCKKMRGKRDSGGITRRESSKSAPPARWLPAAGSASAQPAQQPPRAKGPRVWLDLDQKELDDAYDQSVYAPTSRRSPVAMRPTAKRTRARIGAPRRFAYGSTPVEGSMSFQPRARTHRSTCSSSAAPGAGGSRKLRLSRGAVRERRRELRRPGFLSSADLAAA